MNIHSVKSIELVCHMPFNSDCRTIKITTESGEFQLNVYGETEAFESLPKAEDFLVFHTAPTIAAE
ncbi:MAG: hypothetical protein N4A65_00475 [Cohaesibacter sp.]|jgi:hypothetical protein|nr:hypothetical protein [Cohaesibacter sp.]